MASTNEDSTPDNYASLAERLRDKQAEDQQEVERIMNDHAESLMQRSSDVLRKFENDLGSIQDETVERIRKSIVPLCLIWAAALTGILIGIISAIYVNHQVTQISHNRERIHRLKHLQVKTCAGQPCVKVKPNAKAYGPNLNYRIIQQ